MKHAIMIMAHKNFEFLHHLIEYFTRDCYVFVHIDKKSSITHEQEACLRAMPQVSGVYRKYSVHWGGFSILKCELFLLKQALHSTDADYFHLISGQDYPIKPLSTFLDFFEKNKGKEFIRYANIPHAHWDHYTFSRFQYYYPYDYFGKTTAESKRIVNKIVDWQKRHGIKRRIPDHFEHLYGSTQWFSITRKAVETLLDYTRKHPAFYRRARWTFAAEEYYVATVLVNLLPKKDIERRDLRFIRWLYENGNCPANLDQNHFHLLAESCCLFARKFESPVSDDLRLKIDYWLLNDNSIYHMPTGGWNYQGFHKYKYYEFISLTICKLCQDLKISSLIDLGCGAGHYVAALRRLQIPATGYDANPFTPELSKTLLPEGDEPCGIVDITIPIEYEETFDMVLCMDVLPYIPPNLVEKSIINICTVTAKYVIFSWSIDNNSIIHNQKEKDFELDKIMSFFHKQEMEVNIIISNRINSEVKRKKLPEKFLVFQRKGIIEELKIFEE